MAKEVGMPQNAISRLESPDYGKPTLTTLKRLAAAFDVGLAVRFVPFSELVDWVTSTPRTSTGLSSETLGVPDFENDLGLIERIRPRGEQTGSIGAFASGEMPVQVIRAGSIGLTGFAYQDRTLEAALGGRTLLQGANEPATRTPEGERRGVFTPQTNQPLFKAQSASATGMITERADYLARVIPIDTSGSGRRNHV